MRGDPTQEESDIRKIKRQLEKDKQTDKMNHSNIEFDSIFFK